MIEVTATTALTLYLGFSLLLLLTIWTLQYYRRKGQQVLLPEKSLFICEYCHYAYLKEEGKAVSQCPQCQSYNKVIP